MRSVPTSDNATLNIRWKLSYKLAMRELNPAKATTLVRQAETAMFKRYMEIADSPDAYGERVQMENALDDLSAVKALSLK
jgi:hypothetical protein